MTHVAKTCLLVLVLLAAAFACESSMIVDGGSDTSTVFPPAKDTGPPRPDKDQGVWADEGSGEPDYSPPAIDIHVPPGTEVCNGIDDNDDGVVDEEGAAGCQNYYMDQDGDGFGVDDWKCMCSPKGKYTATQPGDCLDASPYVNPGVEEDCYNAVDDNCDSVVATPQCDGKDCGDDGCGGVCGNCDASEYCTDAFKCKSSCDPQCAGKACGADGCGGVCGTCLPQHECFGGVCKCVPACGGKNCGPDGCGGSCGNCNSNQICDSGNCVCQAQCAGKNCGPDGCGGQCGNCKSYQTCKNNQCLGWKWEAESQLAHEQGKKEGDGWACNTGDHSKNMMVYGPYTTDIPAGPYVAAFRMMVDNNTANNSKVVKLDVNDSYKMDILAAKDVYRKQFGGAMSYQDMTLTFSTNGNQKLEFRVEWFDTSYVRVDRVIVIPL